MNLNTKTSTGVSFIILGGNMKTSIKSLLKICLLIGLIQFAHSGSGSIDPDTGVMDFEQQLLEKY